MNLALKETELSPRELAVTNTDREKNFVSEASVYRALKAHDPITSLGFIVIKAAIKSTLYKNLGSSAIEPLQRHWTERQR